MNTILNRFMVHTKKIGFHLNGDDFKFIEYTLRKTPYNLHRSILMDYCDDWVTGMGKTSDLIKKQNFGRKEANYKMMTKYGPKKVMSSMQ